ncbi:MAG: DNRLRE domain-containing protein [Candidatus Eisenbacteria bacterium]|nr:DNRLRE domain-containing protein [Candidatus Eisenbacteria bacterium]
MKTRVMLPFFLLLLAVSITSVGAKELFVDAADVAAISSSEGSGDTRFLVEFALPEELEGKVVDFACVSFDVSSSGEAGVVSLEAFRVTTAWDAVSVGWSEPWAKAGGDWDDGASADWVAPTGDGETVYLDVTDFVAGWLAEPSSNFGIVVKVSEPFSGVFSADRSQGAPRLRVLYSDKQDTAAMAESSRE